MESTETQQFKEMVMPLLPMMEGVLRRLLTEEADVRDALQEVLLRLWHYRKRLAGVDNVKAYCMGVSRNVAVDMLNAQNVGASLDEAAQLTCPESRIDDLEAVYEALQHLPANQRLVIRLRGCRGMEVDEIAEDMQLSTANVRQLLSRGRRKLKEILSKRKFI